MCVDSVMQYSLSSQKWTFYILVIFQSYISNSLIISTILLHNNNFLTLYIPCFITCNISMIIYFVWTAYITSRMEIEGNKSYSVWVPCLNNDFMNTNWYYVNLLLFKFMILYYFRMWPVSQYWLRILYVLILISRMCITAYA